MPQINVKRPGGTSYTQRFEQSPITIGRAPSNLLVLSDPSSSRFHVEIRHESGRWIVSDNGSRNGTLRNGRPVTGPEPLSSGDEIAVGDTILVFTLRPGEDQPAESREWSPPVGMPAEQPPEGADRPSLLGETDSISTVRATLKKFASSSASVLFTGEYGTGREVAARLLHSLSSRADAPFVAVNCPAFPESLLATELFGTAGNAPQPGRIEAAEGGTLYLDEIGKVDPAVQPKLLRALEKKTVERVGGVESFTIDVRILASTSTDLTEEVQAGAFRAELLYRLNTLSVALPPLRDRIQDLPLLIDHVLTRAGKPSLRVDRAAMDLLAAYEYPGNIRELERIVARAALLTEGTRILPGDLPEEVRMGGAAKVDPTRGANLVDQLYRRVVDGGESFWDAVQKPYLDRQFSRAVMQRFIERIYVKAGGSHKKMAQLLHVESDQGRLGDFLEEHSLRVRL